MDYETEVRPAPSLTDEQNAAVAAVDAFLADKGGPQCFVLNGLAGTGKTTVLGYIARKYPSAILCAFTGKAASVLRDKTGINACTIHSAFYRLEEKRRNEKTGKDDLRFVATQGKDSMRRNIVLIDECSMIDETIARDIIHTGAKIVAVGDPGQLQPVKGRRFFDKADFTLTQIHRQALESPIIRQAYNVRNNGVYDADTDAFRVVAQRANPEDVLEADVILCWTNITRQKANNYKRSLLGHSPGTDPQPGEFVMCTKNAADYGIFNGAVYELEAPFKEGDTTIVLQVDGEIIRIPRVGFTGVRSHIKDTDEYTSWFDYGYAMTVHKSQGSEWDKVIIRDEYTRQDQRREFIYTAITRAAKEVIVIR